MEQGPYHPARRSRSQMECACPLGRSNLRQPQASIQFQHPTGGSCCDRDGRIPSNRRSLRIFPATLTGRGGSLPGKPGSPGSWQCRVLMQTLSRNPPGHRRRPIRPTANDSCPPCALSESWRLHGPSGCGSRVCDPQHFHHAERARINPTLWIGHIAAAHRAALRSLSGFIIPLAFENRTNRCPLSDKGSTGKGQKESCTIRSCNWAFHRAT
jgi:hypothetical protein